MTTSELTAVLRTLGIIADNLDRIATALEGENIETLEPKGRIHINGLSDLVHALDSVAELIADTK